ncbi:MAG TPA: MFS transporter [Ktedonobacteraceae bacterium]|jgi:MFS family permease
MQVTKEQPKTALTNTSKPKGKFLRTFSALQSRNFRLFWTGQLISLIGTWMDSTGQSWLVLQLTHSALALAVTGALQFLPILLFSLFGGVLADRLPKKRMLLFTQSFIALQALALFLLVATHTVQIWHLYILATLLGLTNAVDMPTRQAFVVEMVGSDTLPNAVALNSSIFNMARIVGPGIAGIIIAQLGEAPLFLLNAISFVPVLIGLALINSKQLHRQPHISDQPKIGTIQSLGQGLAYVWKTPAVLLIIAVIGAVSLFGINFNVALPLVATELLHTDAEGFGIISSALGLGALLSALWLAAGTRRPSLIQMLIACNAFSILLGLFALSRWYPLSIALIAATGFAQIAFTAVANTTLQTVTPDHLRGRIMSVYMLVLNGSTPMGNLFIGVLAHGFGISIAILTGAILSWMAAILGWIKRAPALKSAKQVNLLLHDK